jgi:hypothetical protein
VRKTWGKKERRRRRRRKRRGKRGEGVIEHKCMDRKTGRHKTKGT